MVSSTDQTSSRLLYFERNPLQSLKSLPAAERFEEEIRQFCLTGLSGKDLSRISEIGIDPFWQNGVNVYFYERNIYSPIGQKEIDGLLLTDKGVFVLECKNVIGTVTGTLNSVWSADNQMIHVPGPRNSNPVTQIKSRIGPLSSFLREKGISLFLTGVIIFPDEANLDGLTKSGTLSVSEPPNRDRSYIITNLHKLPEILGNIHPSSPLSHEDAFKIADLLGIVIASDPNDPERILRFPAGGFPDISPIANLEILDKKKEAIFSIHPEYRENPESRDIIDGAYKTLRESFEKPEPPALQPKKSIRWTVVGAVFFLLGGLLMVGAFHLNGKKIETAKLVSDGWPVPGTSQLTPYQLLLEFYHQHPSMTPDYQILSLGLPMELRTKANQSPDNRKNLDKALDNEIKKIGVVKTFPLTIPASIVQYDSQEKLFTLSGLQGVQMESSPQNSVPSFLVPFGGKISIGIAQKLPCNYCDSQVLIKNWPLQPTPGPMGHLFFRFAPISGLNLSEVLKQTPCQGCSIPVHIQVRLDILQVEIGRTNLGKPVISSLATLSEIAIRLDSDNTLLFEKQFANESGQSAQKPAEGPKPDCPGCSGSSPAQSL
ncbi:MAG: nuclease-related domain-containing protein [Leptospirillum sp.]